jgi:hypothetical protein
VICAVGCEEKKAASLAPSETAAAAPTATAPAAAAAPTPKEPEKPRETGVERTKDLDVSLTDARRSAVETKYPKAKGFIVAKELEEKLKTNKALKDKKSAVAAFDRAAKGKWVLFTGPAVNLTDTGFDVGITYTPQLPNDPIGMSRQFFEVTLSDVDGYSKDKLKAGDPVVVLAQYVGNAKATPGHELIAEQLWK